MKKEIKEFLHLPKNEARPVSSLNPAMSDSEENRLILFFSEKIKGAIFSKSISAFLVVDAEENVHYRAEGATKLQKEFIRILDKKNKAVGEIKQNRHKAGFGKNSYDYSLYASGSLIARIAVESSFLKSKYEIEPLGWTISPQKKGIYLIEDKTGSQRGLLSKVPRSFGTAMQLDYADDRDELFVVMIAMVIYAHTYGITRSMDPGY